MDSEVAHDAQGNPSVRTILELLILYQAAGQQLTQALTVSIKKNHILGPTYSIQGNILLGQQILDSMQSRFKDMEHSQIN